MSAKKKLIVSLASICVVAFMAIVTIAIVLANANAGVKNGVNITYRVNGNNVAGTVSAEYKLAGDENATAIGTTQTFDGSESTGAQKDLPQADITLTADKKNVVFTYTFTADTSKTSTQYGYTAVLTYTDDSTADVNVKVEVSSNGTDYTAVIDWASANAQVDVTSATAVKYYVRVSIVDTLSDASFSGNFAWAMTAKTAA